MAYTKTRVVPEGVHGLHLGGLCLSRATGGRAGHEGCLRIEAPRGSLYGHTRVLCRRCTYSSEKLKNLHVVLSVGLHICMMPYYTMLY